MENRTHGTPNNFFNLHIVFNLIPLCRYIGIRLYNFSTFDSDDGEGCRSAQRTFPSPYPKGVIVEDRHASRAYAIHYGAPVDITPFGFRTLVIYTPLAFSEKMWGVCLCMYVGGLGAWASRLSSCWDLFDLLELTPIYGRIIRHVQEVPVRF